MKGKELRKRVKEFSHKTNFYKLGLVRKYIKQQYKEKQALIEAIPKVVCPHCGSKKISIEYDESEYSSYSWLYCEDCEEDFEDTFGFKDAIQELDCLSWGDIISVELHFEEPNIKSLEWREFCEEQIKLYLGLIKQERIIF
ncbi:hypothetical protein [Clostridium butyricum]|uniref:PaaD-like zinc ribbon domain-containing protein n=1 Tax=Clostridium butyricum TaxID=1492 RepID=UPI0009041325|nr:hypothetical protein [Clostridium butyricum]APF21698.1 hypothetical protein NPD4_3590 [Clostridium butyricum]